MSDFLYIGRGLTPDEFTTYVNTYDFGSQPPNFVVLHHTAIPDAAWAPANKNPFDNWPAGDYDACKARLNGIMRYYRDTLHWDRGPHLFIDDRWIWLFTPMYNIGIHAANGNGWKSNGRINYSVGIEVVGDYTRVQWPDNVARNVAHAVCTLKQQLGTFALEHRPGPGGICGHRDFNKPSCPGNAITNAYYLQVLRDYWQEMTTDPDPSEPVTWHVLPEISGNPNWNHASIRTGPGLKYPYATHLDWKLPPGTAVEIGALVPDDDGGTLRWVHLADERGFVREDLFVEAK